MVSILCIYKIRLKKKRKKHLADTMKTKKEENPVENYSESEHEYIPDEFFGDHHQFKMKNEWEQYNELSSDFESTSYNDVQVLCEYKALDEDDYELKEYYNPEQLLFDTDDEIERSEHGQQEFSYSSTFDEPILKIDEIRKKLKKYSDETPHR